MARPDVSGGYERVGETLSGSVGENSYQEERPTALERVARERNTLMRKRRLLQKNLEQIQRQADDITQEILLVQVQIEGLSDRNARRVLGIKPDEV